MVAVWPVLIVAFAALLGPMLLAHQQSRQRRREKAEDAAQRKEERDEDYARQDAVAERLTRRQNEVAAETAETAALLLDANERVAAQTVETAAVTNGKLDQIHELVNSTLTGAMQAQLVALEAQLAMIRRFQPDATEEITQLEADVIELRGKLADRARQTEIADAQLVAGTDPP
jgi:hypothetical protein